MGVRVKLQSYDQAVVHRPPGDVSVIFRVSELLYI